MSQSQEPWLGWGVAVITLAVGAAWGFIKRFLSFVTRAELAEILKEQADEQKAQHGENTGKFDQIFDEIAKVKQSQARTEGMLSGRYPRP